MLLPLAHLPLALGFPGGPGEWILIAGVALLLFGKRLPEVGKSLGRGIVEFRKGLKGIDDEVETASSQPSPQRPQIAAAPTSASYKFDPYTGKPLDEARSGSPANSPNAGQ